MKRNPHIIPLSRDHHTALLFGWKIRQGLAKGAALDRIRPYVLYFSGRHLEKHFAEEEELLFHNNTGCPLCDQAIEDHRQIRALVETIRDPEAGTPETYRTLADLLERHIRFEEREVFPWLETQLAPERLARVGAELRQLHQHPLADDYPDAFWN
ncbi:MAG TPA: hemerythrin domain-containing protein [Puia sp.]|uniref:hemerythrin domain-containing protein n=1 Tax=Puia sp. TaxID=2045100 RepID=UPI002CFD4D2B|nr:hemerythrin domain-containing protein [Puia sp.]HVU94327.1 hemerythrin domain-containing protein [Puia sp.]